MGQIFAQRRARLAAARPPPPERFFNDDDADITDILDCVRAKDAKGERFYWYVSDPIVRDPLAGDGLVNDPPTSSQFLLTSQQLPAKFRAFEMYSVAITIILMIDAQQNKSASMDWIPEQRANNGVPVVRKVPQMPHGLPRILRRMTGPIEERGDLMMYVREMTLLLKSLEAGIELEVAE
jgi:hypothetical protein